ncbi:MAG: hypothetical protein FJ086_01215 [Deltaproteobacteria bacterium]|nr:hypothetical protein [Deltaproteobacteria bacterium]
MARDARTQSLSFSRLCAAFGFLLGLGIASVAIGEKWGLMVLVCPPAAFLAGTVTWILVARGPGRVSGLRGALAGALAATLAHPLRWALLFAGIGPDERATSVADMVGVLIVASLILVGWLTVPVGAILGEGMARWLRTDATG